MEGNSLVGQVQQWPVGIKNYVQELQLEMRRVTWPSRKQVEGTTGVVIVTVFAFAAYFYVVDRICTGLVGKVISFFSR